jgi:hypothetical protein
MLRPIYDRRSVVEREVLRDLHEDGIAPWPDPPHEGVVEAAELFACLLSSCELRFENKDGIPEEDKIIGLSKTRPTTIRKLDPLSSQDFARRKNASRSAGSIP